MSISKLHLSSLAAAAILSANSMFAGAIVAGFDANSLAANDDGTTGIAVNFGLGPLNFFGTTYTGAVLNNNGNMTFGGPLTTFTPFGITGGSTPMIAPFFADVDTRPAGSALMTYGNGVFEGRNAFAQTWNGVGYYNSHTNKLNKFQTLIVERSDIAAGDFDIYFNYDQIQWETGDASGGSNGIGGTPARAGYTNGAGTFFELAGSGISGAFLDGGSHALSQHSLNRPEAGRYLFTVRNGEVSHQVPDRGVSVALVGLALVALALIRRKGA